jgi:Nif-specific regulatory protein
MGDPERSDAVKEPAQGSVLLALGPLLRREVDLDALLRRLVDRVAQAVAADRGTVYLLDPEAGELFSRAGHLPELKQIRLKLGQGIAGAVAHGGQLVNLPQAEADRRFFREVDRQTGYKTRSVMAAPLRDRAGQVFGVVQVLNSAQGSFSPDDESRFRRLCAEAALAIEATSLYAEVRPRSVDKGRKLPLGYRYNNIIGESAPMQRVYALVRKAAATDATVLLRGESGTGKELIARAVHYNGRRADGPFVKVDCASLPPTLIENELFGHEKGAYTGADQRAIGKCEAAAGGTLFIDELGELPLEVQAKLLRFLQDREFQRVGGTRTHGADVRVICATHRDLEELVGRGAFREDLYYRVKVVQIALPPLRERGAEDLLRLAEHFRDLYARRHRLGEVRIGEAAARRLLEHHWLGNIRELEHCIESALVLCDGDEIRPEHLALPAEAAPPPAAGFRPRRLAEVEREHILVTLEACGGNRTRAAALLGIGRNTLVRKLGKPRPARRRG